MLKITLEAIETVDTIARTGSFAGASERLHKVPSTISYAVSKLEDQLGIALFTRNGPRVTLTPAGQEMLKEGRWLLASAQQLESRMRQIATGFESELRLVHDSLIPTSAFNPDICAFEDLNCGTRLRIGSEALTGTWEALRDGRADIVIAAGEGPTGGGYKSVAVGSVNFAFCVTATHPLARLKRPLERSDLLEHTAVVVGDGARTLTDRTVGLLAGQRRITVPNFPAKIAAQAAGLGHGFLPRDCVQAELSRGILIELEVQEPRPDETFWLAWRPEHMGEALKWWRQRLDRPLLPGILAH
ncbi:MAG: LysR family transcriptional regulator [Gammaproteobacteria bacterium]|jgi:DNA-binding transcriptional LysR family regulator|nr:LysR family transcriptional regulator [Gammaproteobacteria bacterium]MBU0830370.1 LysR family transcriptional regulator [Gammaproteobacteria bacterium]MBU0892480.1 LysR family transcriptional regulator [Gammaproteobacteria bacterium]MBU1817727.1 LysR family transcriptional regulator [Gammaproteobacteria bacterium]